MAHQLKRLEQEYDVTVIAKLLEELGLAARLVSLGIERQPTPWRDLIALVRLYLIFRRERFDLVHSVTPKAGLLTMIASALAGIPRRVHMFTGQVWATRRGLQRILLKTLDRLTSRCATSVLVDGHSQRSFLINERVVGLDSKVLAHGSVCGVDVRRFRPNAEARRRIREELRIPAAAELLLFVGRLHREKGVLDLAVAFRRLAAKA